MGSKSSIQWTDATWSPLRVRVREDAAEVARQKGYSSLIQIAGRMAGRKGPHCEKVSPGCLNCYSESNNHRCLPANGTGLPFDRRARDLVAPIIDEWILEQPLRWREPKKIFVESQSDLFGEWWPKEILDRIFAVMALLCHWHTFQVLTKRSGRLLQYVGSGERSTLIIDAMNAGWGVNAAALRWPLPNVWLGVSVENRAAFHRIDDLRATPAAVRFLSCEPLLEHLGEIDLAGINWVIAGCESGPGRRPTDPAWLRSIRDQCVAARVPFFLKQADVDGKIESTPLLDGARWTQFPKERDVS